MRLIKVDVDGTVTEQHGELDFLMDEEITWAVGDYRGEKDHFVYYDDEALFGPEPARTTIAGLSYPLPLWIVGADGEDDADATLDLEKVRADLSPVTHPGRDETSC